MRTAAARVPSWRLKLALAGLCFFGTVQAGPAADGHKTTFQMPAVIVSETLTD